MAHYIVSASYSCKLHVIITIKGHRKSLFAILQGQGCTYPSSRPQTESPSWLWSWIDVAELPLRSIILSVVVARPQNLPIERLQNYEIIDVFVASCDHSLNITTCTISTTTAYQHQLISLPHQYCCTFTVDHHPISSHMGCHPSPIPATGTTRHFLFSSLHAHHYLGVQVNNVASTSWGWGIKSSNPSSSWAPGPVIIYGKQCDSGDGWMYLDSKTQTMARVKTIDYCQRHSTTYHSLFKYH